MTRHKRHKHLSTVSKIVFRDSAERFHTDLLPMFRELKPTSEHYKVLMTITRTINAAYPALEINPPSRHRLGPQRTMDGHERFPEGEKCEIAGLVGGGGLSRTMIRP